MHYLENRCLLKFCFWGPIKGPLSIVKYVIHKLTSEPNSSLVSLRKSSVCCKMEDQNGSSGFGKGFRKAKPYLAMVSLQFGYSGMYIITMVSFKHGMSHWVLSVYRHIVATLIMAPFAFFLERSFSPPPQPFFSCFSIHLNYTIFNHFFSTSFLD
ncbi:hypothetical protein V8G54_036186 [Vigna mungo]|uniref:WAT1-related protein n=1 Tax=Vigna mungo TaxID=3915 RepID=A0AAQ3RFC7_VIGMU